MKALTARKILLFPFGCRRRHCKGCREACCFGEALKRQQKLTPAIAKTRAVLVILTHETEVGTWTWRLVTPYRFKSSLELGHPRCSIGECVDETCDHSSSIRCLRIKCGLKMTASHRDDLPNHWFSVEENELDMIQPSPGTYLCRRCI